MIIGIFKLGIMLFRFLLVRLFDCVWSFLTLVSNIPQRFMLYLYHPDIPIPEANDNPQIIQT